jgi:uncharacterized phage protein gp47/JayE
VPYPSPTLADLIQQAEADIASRLGLDALIRGGSLAVLARVAAAMAHGAHGHVSYATEQLFPSTAAGEYLARHAELWGVTRRAAAPATGTVRFAGNDGTLIPAGTILKRVDGWPYATDADGTIAAGIADIAVTALDPGEQSDAAAAMVLTLESPIAGVDSSSTVQAPGLEGGEDQEDDEELRARVRARVSDPPQGGTVADYEAWALEVSGITRAWCLPAYLGGGTVGVAIVQDDESPITPPPSKVDEVQAYIDARRPVTAAVTVFAPTLEPVALELSVTPDTAAVQAAVAAELADLLAAEAVPGGTLFLSRVRAAISRAAGELDNSVTLPAADVVASPGAILTLGTVTFS